MLCCQFNNQNWQTLRSSEKTRKVPSAKASRISQLITLLRKQTRPAVHTMTTLLISMKNFINVVTKQKTTHIISKFQNGQCKNWSIPQYDAKAENLRWLERCVVAYARNAEAIPNLFTILLRGIITCVECKANGWQQNSRFVRLRNPFSRT